MIILPALLQFNLRKTPLTKELRYLWGFFDILSIRRKCRMLFVVLFDLRIVIRLLHPGKQLVIQVPH